MKPKASLKRLRLSNFKLQCLLEITQGINENIPTKALLAKFEKIIREDLNLGRVHIYKNTNPGWDCLLAAQRPGEKPIDIDVEKSLLDFVEITNVTALSESFLKYFDVIIPVYHKDSPLAYVLIGDIDEEREGISPTIKHLHFIQTLANIILVAVENKRLFRENIRQEALKRELAVASRMQNMLIPDPESFPQNNWLKVAAFYKPHSEVGGDYYDFINFNDNEFGFCIADVSGKGISAALLMSNFQANLRALFTTDISLTKLVTILNERVVSNTKGEKFITLFIGKYNKKTKQLQYINAGHNHPILEKDGSLIYLRKGCVGIGMFDEIPVIVEGSKTIDKKAKILCYTDGLVEVENKDKVEFGTKDIEKDIKKNKSITVIMDGLISKLNAHTVDEYYFDDISVLGIELF